MTGLDSPTTKAVSPDAPRSYAVDSVSRAIQLLSAFSLKKPAMTLGELAAATGLPKTTAFRILATLVEGGLCERDPATAKYALGMQMLRFAEIRRRQSAIWDVAAPVMRAIRDEVAETVVLSVRRGDLRMQVDSAEGLHPLRRIAEPGLHAPLYAGAASRVLLAGMEDAEIEAYLRRTTLAPIQKNTMTHPDKLWKEIRLIRARGYAESSNEVLEGGAALAAPIISVTGATIGALDIITPESRYSPERRETSIRVLLEGVARLRGRI